MDLIPRKRKLAEVGTNATVSSREPPFLKLTLPLEENDNKVSTKLQKLNFSENENATCKSVFGEKPQRIHAAAEAHEKHDKKGNKDTAFQEDNTWQNNVPSENDSDVMWFLTDYIEVLRGTVFFEKSLPAILHYSTRLPVKPMLWPKLLTGLGWSPSTGGQMFSPCLNLGSGTLLVIATIIFTSPDSQNSRFQVFKRERVLKTKWSFPRLTLELTLDFDEFVKDIISHEFHKESLYQLSSSFCKKYDVNPAGREILIDWLISVQVNLKAENGTLHLAVALLDTVLDDIDVPLSELQAAAASAFWVAYKFLQGSLSMKTLLAFCAESVTKTTIEDYEILVLQTSLLIQAGGSLTVFFNYLLHKMFGFKFPPEIYYCGLYFMEIMLLQFIFADCPSHEKAATAVFASVTVFECSGRLELVDLSRFVTKQKLLYLYRRLMRSLRLLYSDKNTLKSSNIYRKYKSSRYYKISIHQSLKSLAGS